LLSAARLRTLAQPPHRSLRIWRRPANTKKYRPTLALVVAAITIHIVTIYMAGIAVMERVTRSRTSARIICNRSIREIRMATADMVVISRLITEARTMAVLSGDLVGATVTAAALAIVTTALVTAVATTAAILATAEVATDMDIDK
jgi:hypothetical protein